MAMGRPPRELSKAFGKVLRKHREKKNLSQEALAFQAEVDRTYLGMVERGTRGLSLDMADKFATGLRIPIAKLISEAKRALRS